MGERGKINDEKLCHYWSVFSAMRILLVFFVLALGIVSSAAERKPNFVVIFIDDMGYGDIGPFGSENKTPQLNKLAAEGAGTFLEVAEGSKDILFNNNDLRRASKSLNIVKDVDSDEVIESGNIK